MRRLLHEPFSDKLIGFHVMAEVKIRNDDALHRRQVRAREERVARITASTTRQVPDVSRGNSHNFVTLLLLQVRHFSRRLDYRTVLADNATHVFAEGLGKV